MPYVMSDLCARAGVSSRTIRDYIQMGYLESPSGRGSAASYDEEQMLRAVAAARMRREKVEWEDLTERMTTWSMPQIKAYVARTEPAPPPPPDSAARNDDHAPATSLPPHFPRPSEARTTTELDSLGHAAHDLPEGARYVLCPLLPGLALMVGEGAAPLVRRVANEIVARYGAAK